MHDQSWAGWATFTYDKQHGNLGIGVINQTGVLVQRLCTLEGYLVLEYPGDYRGSGWSHIKIRVAWSVEMGPPCENAVARTIW